MCGHDVFNGAFGLPGFKGKAWAALPDMLFCLRSHVRPEESVMHEIKHALQAQMANLIVAFPESYLSLHSWQD